MAYRWQHTDAALAEQLSCAAEGHDVLAGPGHAAIRFTNPVTGGDALRTIRTEMHRLVQGTSTTPTRHVGSSVWQVFTGEGVVTINDQRYDVTTGDLFAVPSWARLHIEATSDLDAFRFSDEPVYEALGLDRVEREERA
jgi:gentisate 1,2-dioxygenase